MNAAAQAGVSPIILDLDGLGLSVTELSQSTTFVDGGDGLGHRTAWAGAGDGVLFFDADGSGDISERKEYVFTDWDPTATSDLEALRSVFDTNGDGKLSGSELDNFRVMVTQADGTTIVQTMPQLGITEIDLTGDATQIELPDGSVITGRTTFTMNGQSRTVGEMVLATDGRGYRVEETESTGGGVTTRDIEGYEADGALAWAIHVVAATDGSSTVNSYDDDGNGVYDRVQEITVATGGGGETIRTVSNYTGIDVATGVLDNRTVTTLSANGLTETIERDSIGGGWFDQVEIRVTHANGSMTITTTDVSNDGSTFREVVETVSADGLSRTEAIDRDGDGTTDVTIRQDITVHGDGSRTEVVETENGDGSTRSVVTTVTGADGQSRVISHDLDGDGDIDLVEDLDYTELTSGSVSTQELRNQDGSLRSSVTETLSDDALTRTRELDIDGDGSVDRTIVDDTVINTDGSRVHTVTTTNANGSVRDMRMETMSGDALERETWVDLDQDGVIETNERIRSVSVDAQTGERIATTWDRNADGSVNAVSETVTSSDGLSSVTEIDVDGDGQFETQITESTFINSGGDAETITTVRNLDGSLRSRTSIIDVDSGLKTIERHDLDGDGTYDVRYQDNLVLLTGGDTRQWISKYTANGVTLLSQTRIDQSADRRTTTVSEDIDGDGDWDAVTTTSEAVDGSVSTVSNSYAPDGTLTSSATTLISADGLITETDTDLDGDGIVDETTRSETVLEIDGSTTTTQSVENGDGSLRHRSVTSVSDDGLTVAEALDADGDGTFERETTSTTTLNANGSRTTVEEVRSSDNSLLGRTRTTISDDELTVTVEEDRDGDGSYDFTTTQTTVLQTNGTTFITSETRDAGNVLRTREVTTSSSDGRSVVVETDTNGDGQNDLISDRQEAVNGTVTLTETAYDAAGQVEAVVQTVTSANGLITTTSYDRDGNGSFERSVETEEQIGSNGVVTSTETLRGGNGTMQAQTVTTVSDDGLVTTREMDVDGDGLVDRTVTGQLAYGSDGSETESNSVYSAASSLIRSQTVYRSADGRTETETVDLDGNGYADRVTTTELEEDGTTRQTTELYSSGGTLVATFETATSADGLTRTSSSDRNADGLADLVTTDVTSVAANGLVTRDIQHRTGQFVDLARELYQTSADGLSITSFLDVDGDGIWDSISDDVTDYGPDGTVTRTRSATDGGVAPISNIVSVESGNGLSLEVSYDFTGEGAAERTYSRLEAADGSATEAVRYLDASYSMTWSELTTISSDGRLIERDIDLNGDGTLDQEWDRSIDLSGNITIEATDYAQSGIAQTAATVFESANGHERLVSVDLDANGTAELVRELSTTYAADGSQISTFSESYGTGRTGYVQVSTTSANGLESLTTHDVDGDGDIDATTNETTTYNPDGSSTYRSETHYADGTLRSLIVVDTSADGRTTVQRIDHDGNGAWDKEVETTIDALGRTVVTEATFSETGEQINQFVTTTTSDGLETSVLRNGVTQTITRSPVDNGSYVWDNGVVAAVGETHILVSHEVDGAGVETWTVTKTWQYLDQYSTTHTDTSEVSVRLDETSRERVLSEARDLFDAILDRDMDFEEIELLVEHVSDGQLDQVSLAEVLVESYEFSVRFGTLTDAEFAHQIYLNALGRPPSLQELAEALANDLNTTTTRAAFAIDLAVSAEHQVVGNGHRYTNNFDVIMNPAEFERSLDEAEAREFAESLVDVVYDRPATEQEIQEISTRLLDGTDTAEDIAADLLALDGSIQGVSTASLNGLSGSAFVAQAFLNALGREATPAELQTWSNLILEADQSSTAGISGAQFVAALAMSLDHAAVGNGSVPNTLATVTVHTGTSGSNSIAGSSGQDSVDAGAGADTVHSYANSDILDGGIGADSLSGGDGNDTYLWSLGDGNDVISEGGFLESAPARSYGASLIETDTLVLVDVASTQVSLTRTSTSLYITMSGGETVEVANQFYSDTTGYGIEAISFSDGVTWDLVNIEANTIGNGTSGNDSLLGTNAAGDNLFGEAGNDTLYGYNGDDILVGGLGADYLRGGSDEDSYHWALGDGNDTIYDEGSSMAESDRLVLSDVNPDDISLSRSGNHLIVSISGPSGSESLQITNQFYSTGSEGGTTFYGYGIEGIEFADGSYWALQDIYDNTILQGTSGANTLTGSSRFGDNLWGLGGNDTLRGYDGDDLLVGGTGNDYLDGGDGSDLYVWSSGDGNDQLYDTGASHSDLDRLDLTDVSSTAASFSRSGNNLLIAVGGETITVTNQFYSPAYGYGLDVVSFADGVTWDLETIFANTVYEGTSANNTLYGSNRARDNLYGLAGNDNLYGYDGDDWLYGGTGNDYLDGEDGNDRYVWSLGDGNDTIYDTDTDQTAVDVLQLTDVASSDVTLTRSGNNLLVSINSSGEQITITNRYYSSTQGRGIEFIEFSDGVVIEVLNDASSTIVRTGTTGNNVLNGWGFADSLVGDAGADTLNGNDGSDTLIGGTGNDLMNGGDGDDTYLWSLGDGNDTINDSNTDTLHLDRLELADVTAEDVSLSRSGNTLLITIHGPSGDEVISVTNQFVAVLTSESGLYSDDGRGIEAIQFSDGTIWNQDDIVANVVVEGTSGNNTLTGHNAIGDRLYGLGGNDTLNGYDGNDTLVGGSGNDSLQGEDGSDTYIWSLGDGNDTIYDSDTALEFVDRLVLSDVASSDVSLSRSGNHLLITIHGPSGDATLQVTNQYYSSTLGYGLEAISFSDGVTWTADDIEARTILEGTAGADTLTGKNGFGDNLFGLAGNDSLIGYSGDDQLDGGDGNDTLLGGDDNDYLDGGNDNDRLEGGNGDDTVMGGAGYDSIIGGSGNDLIFGGSHHDTIDAGDGNDTVWGDNGQDQVTLGAGDDVFWDNSQHDVSGRDTVFGGTGNDTINGGGGDDEFYGGSDHDLILGDLGTDTLYGDDGDDTLDGGAGADVLIGGAGIDAVSYASSSTGIIADLQYTHVNTGDAVGDSYSGIENLIASDAGGSWRGDSSANDIWGGNSADNIHGRLGDDRLFGGNGNDKLWGGGHNDLLDGGAGNDLLRGESGSDLFFFGVGYDADTINDFEDDVDLIAFNGFGLTSAQEALSFATQSGADVIFDFGDGDILTVIGSTIAELEDDLLVS